MLFGLVLIVMGLTKLSAGDGYTYLIRQVAALDSTELGRSSLESYYSAKGESPGRWLGQGLDGLGIETGSTVTEVQMRNLFGAGHHPATGVPLGRAFKMYPAREGYRQAVASAYRSYNLERGELERARIADDVRSRIKSEVARRLFAERHGRAPTDARELSGFIAQESRGCRAAVSGFDLTFSPVKSVSVLWALAEPEVARQIEAAHQAAVEDTLGWVEREVAFTRSGIGGVRQVQVRGLVATVFTHRDSRAGDPDLHTHVAVSNKVQTLPGDGGRWLALDGRVLFKAKVAASERYNTRLEAELVDLLGVRFVERFVERSTAAGRRPVREIDGVDPMLASRWSSRRHAINLRRGRLAGKFQSDHGRAPTPVELIVLAQQAALETRQAKHEPVSEAAQRRTWQAQAAEWLVGSASAMVASALDRPAPVRPVDVPGLSEQVISVVSESRATWQVWHVRAEAERQARTAGVRRADLDAVIDQVVIHGLDVCSQRLDPVDLIAEPAALQRAGGKSVYEVAGSATYTSERVLAAEQQILTAAEQTDGWRIGVEVAGSVVARFREDLIELSVDQQDLVRELATSGRRVQLALAAAGTGKTTAMLALARVCHAAGGDLVGLAPSAAAAAELGRATGLPTDTLAKLVHTVHQSPQEQWPSWMRAVGPRTLVVVDEAGMASTADLAAAVSFALSRGASVRLVGDDHQLTSVSAGGVLRDLDHQFGAVRLSHLHRFTDPAEAAATLALRSGDAAALGFYADHGRIHVGDLAGVADEAYAAWSADRATGRQSLLLAPTRDLVRELNERARRDRLAGDDAGPEVELGDGTRASRGDLIITRHNERRLGYGRGSWVRNGDRWQLIDIRADGAVLVRSLRGGALRELPAAYVSEHVQLGYASTVHSAQGLTSETCHIVATGSESREVLYVALTRGRETNHVYLGGGLAGNPHTILDPETLAPSTAIEVLARVLDREESQTSAVTARRELADPDRRLAEAALRYRDALSFAAAETLGSTWQASLDLSAETMLPGLTSCPAYPTLSMQLALAELDGRDAARELRRVVDLGDLDRVRDRAAVLEYRLGPPAPGGPLPSLPGIPGQLASSEWGGYLDQRAQLVTTLAAAASPSTPSATVGDSEWQDGLPETVRRDSRNGDLTERLTELARTRDDVPTLLADARSDGPLPTEVPADALWWRVAGLAAVTAAPVTPARLPVPPRLRTSVDPQRESESVRYSQRQRPDHGRGPSR
ncbi:MAG: primase catalytic core, N-terminal domain [Marmoricola sp.]|nr:primase catalytic core, N-terminal domain [Marmoricola sp.]